MDILRLQKETTALFYVSKKIKMAPSHLEIQFRASISLRLAAYTSDEKKYQELAGQIIKSYKTTLEKFPVPVALPALTSGLM